MFDLRCGQGAMKRYDALRERQRRRDPAAPAERGLRFG